MADTTKKIDATDYYTREDVSDTEVLLKITLPADAFTQSYDQLLKARLETTDIKGFRKGNVPKDMIEKEIKPALLYETFERLAPYYVNGAIMKEDLEPVAPPAYKDLEDLDIENAVIFTVSITILPKFKLGKISKIKVSKPDTKATKEEIDNTIKTMHENNEKSIKSKKMDDAWAKEIGVFYKFEDVKTLKDLKKVIAEAIEGQKSQIAEREQVANVIREAVTLSNIELPEAAVTYETEQREDAFMKDIKDMDSTVEDFCTNQGITLEDLKERWKKDSVEALENDILFKLYAEDKKIDITSEEMEAEVKRIKDAAIAKEGESFDDSGYDDPQWRNHIRSFLVKQKAYDAFILEMIPTSATSATSTSSVDSVTQKKTKKKAK